MLNPVLNRWFDQKFYSRPVSRFDLVILTEAERSGRILSTCNVRFKIFPFRYRSSQDDRVELMW